MMSPSLSILLVLVAAAAFGVPAKDLDNKSGFVRFRLGQSRRPLPPPSEGWLVIMQRFDFSVDFNRNWREYRNGFGELDLQKEFWLGNEAIHLLTSRFAHKLRIELLTNESLFYADYDSFSIDSENKNYTLRVSGYSGNAGNALMATEPVAAVHDGLGFSTWDADNDNSTTSSCSNMYKGGWWFNGCYYACLTCQKVDSFRWISLSTLGFNPILIGARMRVMRK